MSYQGYSAEIPLGEDGLIGTPFFANIKPSYLIDCNNVTFTDFILSKEGGSAKFNSTAISGNPKILGGWDWWSDSVTQRTIVYTNAGAILKDSGTTAFPVTLASGLNATAMPVFVEGGKEAAANNKKLFIFNGANVVQVLSGDGATTSNISTPPTDWSGANQPSFGVLHEGRLWGFGNGNDKHRAYYSMLTNHESFTGSGSGNISVFSGEGDGIVGGISYKGLLLLFKYPLGIYAIDTSNADITLWRVKKINGKVGGVSPNAIVMVDNDVIFLDSSGNVVPLSGIQEFGDIGGSSLSHLALMRPFIEANIDLTRLNKTVAIYHNTEREIYFGVSSPSATVNDRRLVVDFGKITHPRFRFSDKDTCESLWIKMKNNKPVVMSGDDNGFVWELDQINKNKDGVGYSSSFQIPHLDFSYLDKSLAQKVKYGQFLEIFCEPTGNYNLSVDILWDGVITQTVNFNMGQTGVGLGDFVLGTDILGGDVLIRKKKRICGGGERFSFIGRNSGINQNFKVSKAILYFTIGDEKETA